MIVPDNELYATSWLLNLPQIFDTIISKGNRPIRIYYDLIELDIFQISITPLTPEEGLDCYVLSIYKPVFLSIYNVLYVILSDNSILEGIGTSSHTFQNIPLTQKKYDFNCGIEQMEVKPRFDSTRIELLQILAAESIGFLLHHEAGHILNGHVKYLKENGLETYSEGKLNKISAIDNQTLEMDADSFAINQIFNYKWNKFHFEKKDIISNIDHLFESFAIGYYCLFYITSYPFYPKSSIEMLEKSPYMSVSMRAHTVGATIATKLMVNNLYDEFGEPFHSANAKALHLLSKLAINEIIDLNELSVDFKFYLSQEANDWLLMVCKNWNKWIPLLTDYASFALSPGWEDE